MPLTQVQSQAWGIHSDSNDYYKGGLVSLDPQWHIKEPWRCWEKVISKQDQHNRSKTWLSQYDPKRFTWTNQIINPWINLTALQIQNCGYIISFGAVTIVVNMCFSLMASVKHITQSRCFEDQAKAPTCRHFCFPFESHSYCPACRLG